VALSNPQKRHLRSLAHHLKPVVMIGQHGMKDSILEELEIALDSHELIKVRVSAGDREERSELIERMIAASGAELVQTIGHIAVLFRRNPEKPKVVLPSA
jgi:RNA-binding protein